MDLIAPFAFPYAESPHSHIGLNKLFVTDHSDSSRFVIVLDESPSSTCKSISLINTGTQTALPIPLNYISNASYDPQYAPNATPLLLRLPPAYQKLKLSVTLKAPQNNSKRSLVILKTAGVFSSDTELRLLLLGLQGSENRDVSRISYSQLPLKSNSTSPQRIIINDTLNRTIFDDCRVCISLWQCDDETDDYAPLFSCQLWADGSPAAPFEATPLTSPISPLQPLPDTKSPSQHVRLFRVSDYRKAFGLNFDDGPEFRKLVARYEAELPSCKKIVTNLVDELKALETCLSRLQSIRHRVIDCICNLTSLQFNGILTKLNFKKEFVQSLLEIFIPFERNLNFFLNDVCDKKLISKISAVVATANSSSSNESNELVQQKKQFENNSKEYYSWLNKYLSNEKERPELKLLLKRKNFELSKFDYLNTLNLITNNQYFNELLENFFKFTSLDYDASTGYKLLNTRKFRDVKQSQDLLQDDYAAYLNVVSRFNSEKFQFRQLIEASQSNEELTNVVRHNKIYSLSPPPATDDKEENPVVTKDNIDMIFMSVSGGQASSVTAVAEQPSPEDQNSELSGILYTLGGQGKPGWHKEWVVLRKGELLEYSDWRKGRTPINRPIQIALSNVKPTTHDKRQFCFEIHTSSGSKHVFQAINEDERRKWIKALYNAGQLVNKKLAAASQAKAKTLNKLVTDFGSHKPQASFQAGQSLDRSVSPVSIVSSLRITEQKNYLSLVRAVPEANNHICVDCGSQESVEWISINCLVCFCLNCSSGHRNLGTHISKIRSLKLDNFDNETEFLLHNINNAKMNRILEFGLPRGSKIRADASAEERLEFIRSKYVTKKYLPGVPGATDLLVKAIQKIDIGEVLKYIICGADLNSYMQISIHGNSEGEPQFQQITVFEYSLRKFVEDEEHQKYFVVLELLLLNGCNIEGVKELNKEIGLTEEAVEYWRSKRLRM